MSVYSPEARALQSAGAMILVLGSVFVGLLLGGWRWAILAPVLTFGLTTLVIGLALREKTSVFDS